jgi:uncharacterized membrane protein YdjX (TVP38/TMEM64 family)
MRLEKRRIKIKFSFKNILNLGLVFFIFLIAYWLLFLKTNIPIPNWLAVHRHELIVYVKDYPTFSIFVFCLLHFFSAVFSIPGSCTFLNIASGLCFGLKKGIIIVYLITMFSGICSYFLGRKLSFTFLENRFEKSIFKLKTVLESNDFFSMIAIRLSPFLPYGALNLLLGYLKVPFTTFVSTTFVGIFFDVVLLNSIGAVLAENSESNVEERVLFGVAFFILFISFYLLKLLKPKLQWLTKNRRN